MEKIIDNRKNIEFVRSLNVVDTDVTRIPSADLLSLSRKLASSSSSSDGTFEEKVDMLATILSVQEPFNRPSLLYNVGNGSFPVPSFLRSAFPVSALRYEALKKFNGGLPDEERSQIHLPRYLHNN